MTKLKEKFNNNEKIKLIKELWSNKKTRAWVWFGFYFVFFLVLSILMRTSRTSDIPITSSDIDNNSNYALIISNLEKLSKNNYKYKLTIYDEVLNGKLENGTNSFMYNEEEYVFVYNKLYLNNESNLELLDNFLNSEIPIELINIDYILTLIKDKQYETTSIINQNYEIIYDVSSFEFLNIDSDDNVQIKLIGRDNITNKIIINYKDNSYILEII